MLFGMRRIFFFIISMYPIFFNLTYNNIYIKGQIFVCVGVKYLLTFDILYYMLNQNRSDRYLFYTPIIFKKSLNTGFSFLCRVRYYSKKQAFNELL